MECEGCENDICDRLKQELETECCLCKDLPISQCCSDCKREAL